MIRKTLSKSKNINKKIREKTRNLEERVREREAELEAAQNHKAGFSRDVFCTEWKQRVPKILLDQGYST